MLKWSGELIGVAGQVGFFAGETILRSPELGAESVQEVVEALKKPLRGQPAHKVSPTGERASDASKNAVVHAMRQRVTALDDQRQQLLARIQQLEERIEVLYGELYANRSKAPFAKR